MSTRLWSKHFGRVREKLITDFRGTDIAKHGGLKGTAREIFIQEFLRTNMPSEIDFSNGEIVDKFDNQSGQLDIIIQSSFSPKIPIQNSTQLSLNDAVIGAIEVKSDLASGKHLDNALNAAIKVKSLHRDNHISGMVHGKEEISHTRTPFFLIAYSGPSHMTLERKFNKFVADCGMSTEQCLPEVTVVMQSGKKKSGYYLYQNNGWLFEKDTTKGSVCSWNKNSDECIVGLFVYLCQLAQATRNNLFSTDFGQYFLETHLDVV
ncbi:MAG: DUF6602 domain-containing protein [Cyanobacteria bacterium P01_F01_bin.86]